MSESSALWGLWFPGAQKNRGIHQSRERYISMQISWAVEPAAFATVLYYRLNSISSTREQYCKSRLRYESFLIHFGEFLHIHIRKCNIIFFFFSCAKYTVCSISSDSALISTIIPFKLYLFLYLVPTNWHYMWNRMCRLLICTNAGVFPVY